MSRFPIAKLGKTVGLKGEMKIYLETDFPEQFASGNSFESDGCELTIKHYNPQKSTVTFVGYEDIDAAKSLTNKHLYSDEAKTRQMCKLEEGEMFWFDLLGKEILEEGKVLGSVKKIDRIGDTEYFLIQTAPEYASIAKTFLIPNIERYVLKKDERYIHTQECMDILEAS